MGRIRTFALTLGVALALTACGESGTYYERSPAEVEAALKSAVLPTAVLGSAIKRSHVFETEDGTIVTALLDADGMERARFVSTVVAEGSGSRVATEVVLGEEVSEAAARNALGAYASGLLESLAQEHVAAAIEGRPFDLMFATSPVAVAAMPADMREQVAQANEAAEAVSRMDQDLPEGGFDTGSDWVDEGGGDWGS